MRDKTVFGKKWDIFAFDTLHTWKHGYSGRSHDMSDQETIPAERYQSLYDERLLSKKIRWGSFKA
ncbi:MAG: hypothetical protein RIR97_1730 [Pseudomonadota bacterium]|jgi:hypothetical protein